MEAPQIQPPPNPVKNAPTVTPSIQRFGATPSYRPTEVEHPQYGAHQSVPQKFDPNADPADQFKTQQEHFKQEQEQHKQESDGLKSQYQDEQKAHDQDRKILYESLSSRINRVKIATDSKFHSYGSQPSSWTRKGLDQLSPAPEPFNFWDKEKNPTAHSFYAGLRPWLMWGVTGQHQYAGIQPDMALRSEHPIIQNQLQAGMGRYDPSRDKMMQSLQRLAQPVIQKFTGSTGIGFPGENA